VALQPGPLKKEFSGGHSVVEWLGIDVRGPQEMASHSMLPTQEPVQSPLESFWVESQKKVGVPAARR
jgi:hypothetical protein